MIARREFIAGLGAFAALPAFAQNKATALTMPPLLDATKSGRFAMTAQAGKSNFLGNAATDTWGFNQSYLGPTLRMADKGDVQAEITNTLNEEISVHWHGALVPGDVDGGPHQKIAPGTTWKPVLPIDQPPATLWYHSHIHGSTARHVQKGLAGVMQISDGQDDQRGLPDNYGVDDLTLVLQDRIFNRSGQAVYDPGMHNQMMGFEGDTMLVNGQTNAVARIPKAVIRLRLVNGSNARVYALAMSDGRPMHLVATEAGLLDQPAVLKQMTLAPGERAEVLVDFTNGQDARLLTGPNPNSGMMGGMMGGGMMGGGMMGGGANNGMVITPFSVDAALPARITKIPAALGGTRPQLSGENLIHRKFTLNMSMGMGMGIRRMFGIGGSAFSINGDAFDMGQINFNVKPGAMERWTVAGEMMMHPFHIHGTSFQVLSENGGAPRLQNRGWKDTVLVNGQVELLMRFDHPADSKTPYMYHCHILEHEDGGMMGQFTVS